MPFDDFTDPFNPPANRRRVPTLSQDQETSLLGGLLEGSLGGLAYVGKLADKTFGGRAVRGLLGGNTGEALSVLPFSDTLGLTDERNAVQGTDLLANAGLITPGDHSIENQIAGGAAEIALDPAMYFGAAVPKAVLGNLGRAGRFAGRNAGAGLEAVTGVNPYTYGARKLDDAYVSGRALFDNRVAGATSRYGQGLAETTYTPKLAAGREAADQAFAHALDQGGLGGLEDYAKRIPEKDRGQLGAALVQNAESYDAAARARLAGLGVFQQPEIDDILRIGTDVASRTRATRGAEEAVGAASKEFNDVPEWAAVANKAALDAGQQLPFPQFFETKYFPRTAGEPPTPGSYGRAQRSRLSAVGEFQEKRLAELRGIPGGTLGVEDLVRDPRFTGAGRTLTPLQVEDELLQRLTGFGNGPVPQQWAGQPWADAAWAGARKQAKDLGEYLGALPDRIRDEGLFSMDFLGNARARQADSARVVASGETMIRGLSEQAKPLAQIQAAGGRGVSLEEALQKSGLTHTDPVTGTPVAKDKLAAALGVQPQDLKSLAVPQDVFDDMMRIGQAWHVPDSVAPVIDVWDRVVNLFKGGLTSPFPAFHVRNLMSGVFNQWRAGVLSKDAASDMLSVLRGGQLSDSTIAKLYPGMAPEQATRLFREQLVGNNVAFTRSGMTAERVGPLSPVTRQGLLPGDLPDVGGAVRPLGDDVGGFLAGTFRTGARRPSSSTRSTR
jgi:hypothetical protein